MFCTMRCSSANAKSIQFLRLHKCYFKDASIIIANPGREDNWNLSPKLHVWLQHLASTIIPAVRRYPGAGILLWLIIPLVLILLLGIAIRAYTVTEKLGQARSTLEQDASPESARQAARWLAEAAEGIPWANALW